MSKQPPPDDACLTHHPPSASQPWQRASPGYRTCGPCCDRMHEWLSRASRDEDGWPDGIPGLYAMLDPRPRRTLTSRDIRRPQRWGRSPAVDHIVAMRDARTAARIYPHDPCAAPAILQSWVRYVWEERFDAAALEQPDYLQRVRELLASATNVNTAAAWLDRQLDWLTRQEVITEFHEELRELRSALRNVGSRRVKIGHCPNTIDEGQRTRECGAALFVPLYSDVITCWAPDCRRRWTRDQWLALGDLMDDQ